MPGFSALAQLRDLLPLVDRLLPLVTRAAGKAAHAEAVALGQQIEQLQGESRGLRAQSGEQIARLERVERSVGELAGEFRAAEERRSQEHRELLQAVSRQRSVATAMLAGTLLVALLCAVLLVILLLRTGHAG